MVYEQAVWIKMVQMTFSICHTCGISVHQVYKLQQSFKFDYK